MAEIVGRERELALLEDFVGAQERPAALVLSGEAGIGKTVLWEAAVARARATSQQVLACRPSEAETTLAFAALSDLLEPLAETNFRALPRPQRHALGVALLLEPAVGPPPDLRAIGSALVATLNDLAQDGPVLLAVDDVQWLDRASADALEPAARLHALAEAYRQWALTHPHRYMLMLGHRRPVGYEEPEETIPEIHRSMLVLLDALADLAAGKPHRRPSGRLARQLIEWAKRRDDREPPPPLVLQYGVTAWTRLHGIVSLEIEGVFASMGLDGEALVTAEMDALIAAATA